jgi:superfamily II DNA or RNA helicase
VSLTKLPAKSLQNSVSQRPFSDRLPRFIVDAITAYGYDLREYQAEATLKAISLLSSGKNAEICLPPGTGKTLISQMIASIWLNRRAEEYSRVLCLVPNTNLLYQHFSMSDWAYQARLWEPLKIETNWRRQRRRVHEADLNDSRVWFALPRQLVNAIERDDISRNFLESVSLVIVDEYDFFSKSILGDEPQQTLAFKDDMLALQQVLQSRERSFLFMSATPPKYDVSEESDNQEESTIWEKLYSPKLINIPREYIPLARVTPIGIEDARVFLEDCKIRAEIGKKANIVLTEVLSRAGQKITIPYLIPRIDAILRSKQIVLPDGRHLTLGAESIKACREVKNLKFYRLCIFEDLSRSSLDYSEDVDFPSDWSNHLSFSSAAKVEALASLLKYELHESHRIVVFIRYVNTVIGVAQALTKLGIENKYVFGDQGSQERETVLRSFKSGEISVLIASRELFGRGFDLPEADVAIFYSPKDNVRTIWQEFLRIRGTTGNPKHIYLMFYLWTAEMNKMERLLHSMWQRGCNQAGEGQWWDYFWDYTEESREGESEPSDFVYFDFSSQEGATFSGSISYTSTEYAYQNFNNENRGQKARYKQTGNRTNYSKTSSPDGLPPTERFSMVIADAISAPIIPWNSNIRPWLTSTAQSCGLIKQYTSQLVDDLLTSLIDAIENPSWADAKTFKSRKRILLIHVHPDHHQGLTDDARSLFNDITACFIKLL